MSMYIIFVVYIQYIIVCTVHVHAHVHVHVKISHTDYIRKWYTVQTRCKVTHVSAKVARLARLRFQTHALVPNILESVQFLIHEFILCT